MARSEPEKQRDTNRDPNGAEKRGSADETAPQRTIPEEDKIRSDWEGMAPRPDQASDDIASPGTLPRQHRDER